MNGNQQSALAALKSVEPIALRLDGSRSAEDRAADILELWQGTETSLRALMGGSQLSGQGLIRELRQRELISLGQAYALLEFLGARDRANRTTYKATDNDVVVAREGYRQLEAGLVAAASEPAPQMTTPVTPLPPPPEDTSGGDSIVPQAEEAGLLQKKAPSLRSAARKRKSTSQESSEDLPQHLPRTIIIGMSTDSLSSCVLNSFSVKI